MTIPTQLLSRSIASMSEPQLEAPAWCGGQLAYLFGVAVAPTAWSL